MPEPTPRKYNQDWTPLAWSPECCDRWVARPDEVQVPSRALELEASNFPNAMPLAAVGSARDMLPDCSNGAIHNRWAVYVSYIKGSTKGGQPAGIAPPLMHIEARAGFENVVSRVGRFVWTPNGWDDYGLLFQIVGPLSTSLQLWGWAQRADAYLTMQAKFVVVLDRSSATPPDVDGKPVPLLGPNVTVDTSV